MIDFRTIARFIRRHDLAFIRLGVTMISAYFIRRSLGNNVFMKGLLGFGLSTLIGSRTLQYVESQQVKKTRETRRGTRGQLRTIRRHHIPLTNLHIEAESLAFDGWRHTSDVVEVARRLKQIAMSSGLEVYYENEVVRIPVDRLNTAMVDSAVRDSIAHITDSNVVSDLEQELEDRDMAMRRLLLMGNAGQILSKWGWFKIQALKCGAYVFGSSYLVGRN